MLFKAHWPSIFVKTLRVQKLVQHFHPCKAHQEEDDNIQWHKPDYHIKSAAGSIICWCSWLVKLQHQQFRLYNILLDCIVFAALKTKPPPPSFKVVLNVLNDEFD